MATPQRSLLHQQIFGLLATLRLQESPSQSAVRAAIQRAIQDEMEQSGADPMSPCYIADVFEEDGYFVYQMNGEYFRRDYTMQDDGTAALGQDEVEVIPETVYNEVQNPMEEAYRAPAAGQQTDPIVERYVSQKARKGMSKKDFAGKGTSFPIETPEDVHAAARSMGRAGSGNYSTDQLKRNITRIAKRKGPAFVARLPKSWREAAAPVSEALEIESEYMPLLEGVVAPDGTALVKLIQPGWGTKGYYSADILKRDLPRAFPKGTEMFWNHPTAAEEAARPEGSLDTKAAVLQEDARFIEQGPAGPGGYARAKIFEHYQPFINDMGPDIGVSIRGEGRYHVGEAEGRQGRIIDAVVVGKSADFVTRPGAGGRIVQLFESAGRREAHQGSENMTEQETKELKDLRESNARQSAQLATVERKLLLRESADFVRSKLAGARIPEVSKARLVESLVNQTPDGPFDPAKMAPLVEAAVAAEAAYVASITGSGRVMGLGPGPAAEDPTKINESLVSSFVGLGLSEAAAKIAAKGRAS